MTTEQNVTHQAEAFCLEYVQDYDPVAAYRRCRFSPNPGSDSKVRVDAFRLMRHVAFQDLLQKIRQEAMYRTKITVDRTLQELGRIAFADPRQAFDRHGYLLPVSQMPENVTAAVASIKTKADGSTELKFWDKVSALDKIMRNLGGYEEDNKQPAEAFAEAAKMLSGDQRRARILALQQQLQLLPQRQ